MKKQLFLTLTLGLISLPLVGMDGNQRILSGASAPSAAAAAAITTTSTALSSPAPTVTSNQQIETPTYIVQLNRDPLSFFSLLPRDVCNLVINKFNNAQLWYECQKLIELLLKKNTTRETLPACGYDLKAYFETLVKISRWLAESNELLLWYATTERVEHVIKLLLLAPNIKINKEHYIGWTALGYAANNGHATVAQLLLTAPSIDVNRPSILGTPLYCAACKGHETLVKLLLAAPGIDVNKPYNDGTTPLYCAACNGHETVVKHLTQAGACITTALQNAQQEKNTNAIKLLQKIDREVKQDRDKLQAQTQEYENLLSDACAVM